MPLDAGELDERVKKLRKTLENFPKNPTVDGVQHLGTRARHAIAHGVLAQHRGCQLIVKIGETRKRKFKEALRVTEQMRRRYLPVAKQGKKSRGAGGRRKPAIAGPELVATSEIAA